MSIKYSSKGRLKRKLHGNNFFKYNKTIIKIEETKNISEELYESISEKLKNDIHKKIRHKIKACIINVKDPDFLNKFSNFGSIIYKDQFVLEFMYEQYLIFGLDNLFIKNDYLYCVQNPFSIIGHYGGSSKKRIFLVSRYFKIYKIKLNDNFKAKILMEKYI